VVWDAAANAINNVKDVTKSIRITRVHHGPIGGEFQVGRVAASGRHRV
jgi:methylglyoxal synthase